MSDTMAHDPDAVSRVRLIRQRLGAGAGSPSAPAPRPAEDDLTRARRRNAELERLVQIHRERDRAFEVALLRIHGLTRRLTGQTTSAVHTIASDVLGVAAEPPLAEEPF